MLSIKYPLWRIAIASNCKRDDLITRLFNDWWNETFPQLSCIEFGRKYWCLWQLVLVYDKILNKTSVPSKIVLTKVYLIKEYFKIEREMFNRSAEIAPIFMKFTNLLINRTNFHENIIQKNTIPFVDEVVNEKANCRKQKANGVDNK